MSDKKNILITGTGGRSVGSGILHSLLGSSKEVTERWNVIAADADRFAWGLYVAPRKVVLPMANAVTYFSELRKAVERFKIHAIVPGTEPEVLLLANHPDMFPGCKIICNKAELMPLMSDKFKMAERLKKMGLKFIETFPLADYEKALNAYKLPFIIKPTSGTGGSKNVEIVTTIEELKRIIALAGDKSNLCIQPYIGDAENEYTVGVLSDKHGNLIDSIVMKRKLIGLSLQSSKRLNNKTYSISSGYSQGYIIEEKEVAEFCERIAKNVGSTGPLNIQLRKQGSEFYIFDFHPRFSGTTPIRADVGFNEVDILLRNHLFDEKFERLNYKTNVAAIRAFEHVIVPIDEMQR